MLENPARTTGPVPVCSPATTVPAYQVPVLLYLKLVYQPSIYIQYIVVNIVYRYIVVPTTYLSGDKKTKTKYINFFNPKRRPLTAELVERRTMYSEHLAMAPYCKSLIKFRYWQNRNAIFLDCRFEIR